jgi:hypothetical protein
MPLALSSASTLSFVAIFAVLPCSEANGSVFGYKMVRMQCSCFTQFIINCWATGRHTDLPLVLICSFITRPFDTKLLIAFPITRSRYLSVDILISASITQHGRSQPAGSATE